MRTLKYLFISGIATGLIFLFIGAVAKSFNISDWAANHQIGFLLFVAFVDIYLINRYNLKG